MNLKELRALRDETIEAMTALNEKCITEVRHMSDTESDQMRGLEEKFEQIENDIKVAKQEIRSNAVKIETIKEDEKVELTKNELELRAIEQCIKGEMGEELRAVTTTTNGADVTAHYIQNEIVKRLEEVAPLFAKATRYVVSDGDLSIPREDDANLFDFGFVGENEEVSEHALSFNAVTLDGHRCGAVVTVTNQMAKRVSLDMSAYVIDLLVRRFGASLDKAMITGTVLNKSFQGLDSLTVSTDKIVEITETALTSDVLLDALHAVHPTLLAGAEYIMNRKTFNVVSKLKDSNGQYILITTRDVANNAPAYTIFGQPVSVNDAMTDNNIYFANIHEGYASLVRQEAKLSRVADDSVNLRKGTQQFFLDADLDAKCKNSQAIVRVKITA